MSLAAKLVKIMASCAYIQKDSVNEYHKYSYASAAAVLEKVNAACVANGIATLTHSKILNSWERVNGRGNAEYYKEVEVEITLIDCDTGEEKVISGIGCGMDTGDKAVMKAQTAAIKYAWLMALQISTGDDPEADANTDKLTQEPGCCPVYQVEKLIVPPSRDRAKVILLVPNTGEQIEAIAQKSLDMLLAQKIGKGNKITCTFGEYTSPQGKTYPEILTPRKIA
ncbi:ERF family protein [Syntrophomonas palmitatica]|uniref:ERF family protein n=1 Tax=Syntrophomonas palmitatica TaxID=402877 RepID=UPI0006CF95D2|nr:ERF family protein [Syntrophomonas palmitatica]